MTAKPELLFLIDEAQRTVGLMNVCQTKKEVRAALHNILSGIRLFEPRYKVSLLVYPTYIYCAEGFGKNPDQPLNRLAPTFHYLMEYCEEEKIDVYLEAYSSGIRTQEHEGIPGGHTPAPLHYGDEARRKSLPLDMECLAAIKEAYPDTLAGIRFHELIGSNDQGLKARAEGREEMCHGWVAEDEVMRSYIDVAAKSGLKLVWSDHSWNRIVASEEPLVIKDQYMNFKTWLDYAVDTLGAENVTLNWANNGWPMHQYITGHFMLKNYRGTNYGESNQSWFWQETECSTLRWAPDGKHETTKWYVYPDVDMPIELTAIFCLRALNGGATMIQFEPTDYLFNFHSHRFFPIVDAPAHYEKAPDFSPRDIVYRLADYLNHPEKPRLISDTLTDYYTEDEGIFQRNLSSNPPKRYTQTTLGLLYPDHQRFFDAYNAFPGQFEENSEHRFPKGTFDQAVQALRANMTFGGIDEMLVLRPAEKGCLMDAYTCRGGKLLRNETVAADEQLLSAASANLFEEYVDSLEGSGDDLLLVLKKKDSLSFKAFHAVADGPVPLQRFQYAPASDSENKAVLTRLLGRTLAPAKGFVSLSALRTACGIDLRSIQPADEGAVLCYENGLLLGAWKGVPFEQTLRLEGKILCAAPADVDFDFRDELALVVWDGEKAALRFAKWNGSQFELLPGSVDLGSEKPSCLFALRWGSLYNIR